MNHEALDEILRLQLAVAWAGEGLTDPPRLGWWRTALCDEFGGEDLFGRLAPGTARWAVTECAWAAAVRVDEAARSRADDPDHIVTLYRFGFETDERLHERLRERKLGGEAFAEAFPDLDDLFREWDRERFASWLREVTSTVEVGASRKSDYTATATGRRLRGRIDEDPVAAARRLAAALLPFDRDYSLPHFRIDR